MKTPALLCVVALLRAAESAISGSGDASAEFGGEARYGCSIKDLPGVLQVTWQRKFKDESIENLATYSKRFGQQVNKPNQGRVVFAEASLNSTEIAIKNVTWRDESCYICSFHVYPDGSTRKQTCLSVKGISNVTSAVHTSSAGDEGKGVEVTVTCTATGKPSPTIRWDLSTSDLHYSQSQTSVLMNSDSTFTASSNISLQVPSDWKGYVDCLVNSGRMGERRERIPLSLNARKNQKDKGKPFPALYLVLILITLLITCIVAAFIALRRGRLKKWSRNEVIL